MSFTSMLPLAALVGVPIIIILYLMKPKGSRRVVPSVLLWKNAEKNEKSTTFSKRLIRNILMYLEIAALLFLMFAAMSPVIKRGVKGSTGSSIIVIDISGSMQFEDESGRSRLEQAVLDAKDIVDMSAGDITIITSGADNEILINGSSDKQRLRKVLNGISPTDAAGDISRAEGLLESLDKDEIVILTDGDGASKLESMSQSNNIDIKVYGDVTGNVGLTQMSMKKNADGLYDIAIGYETVGAGDQDFDISLYDEGGKLLEVRTISVTEDTSSTILMMGKDVEGSYVKAEITEASGDGLSRDNTAYALVMEDNDISAYMVGVGNTYFEKAYTAYSDENLTRVTADSEIEDAGDILAIYDRGDIVNKNYNRIVQDYHPIDAETIEGAIVTVRTGDLINDMSDYAFGASDLSVLECPDWASPLMVVNAGTDDEKVVAYYGEDSGVRQVVLGFDIRDSEYPLMAEFPIFVADSIAYLTDDNMVQSRYIQAGEGVVLSPSVGGSVTYENADPQGDISLQTAGLKIVTSMNSSAMQQESEYYVVRYPVSEADGTLSYEGMSYIKNAEYGIRLGSLTRLCLIFALLIIIVDSVIFLRRSIRVRRLEIVIRCALILLIILSIIGISLFGRKRKTATIFLVDMSDSNLSSLEQESEYIRSSVQELPDGESYGVVTFGRNAMSDQFLSQDKYFYDIATRPDGSATDIEGAVDYAISLIPENYLGRIVVLSDGRETVGDISALSDKLSDAEIEICARLYDSARSSDVYLQSVEMPEKLAEGDAYTMKVTVYSTYETEASIKLWDRSILLDEMSVHLSRGENTFALNETAGSESIEERTVTVEAAGDEEESNNTAVAAAIVEAPQRVLLISGMSEDSTGLESMLEKLNIEMNVVSAHNAPDTISGILKYKTVILDNCYIGDLPEELPGVLQTYIRDYGGGLICTGGRESYAPGGYRDTILEDILPVDMMPKGVDEAPSLALVMAIDCSGSMDSDDGTNRKKIDVAVDAAMMAVDNLSRNDYVGVITFSDTFTWRQAIVQVDDKEAIKDKIEEIGIMGGTVIKPAVIDAAKELRDVDAGVKHIILLTDGEGETTDFSDAIELINDNNITMSTIAIGSDSDRILLEELADKCGGRYYYSDSSSEIPKIFTEEVYLSGETYFKNGDFELSVSNNKLVSELYQSGLPNISGYIAVTTKNGAREIITTDQDDPLLSAWQYGLGHSVAWMSTASGTWNEELSQEQDYLEMWSRLLDYVEMEGDIGQDVVSVSKRRGRMEISYEAADYSEDTAVTGVVTSPSGVTKELRLEPGEPGAYSSSIEADEMGVYSLNIIRREGEDVVASTTAIETVQFSDEYKRDVSNTGFISFVEANGRLLNDGDKIFTRLRSSINNRRDITRYLILLAILVLLLDIAVRRLGLGIRHKAKSRRVSREKSEKREEPEEKEEKESAVAKMRRSPDEDKSVVKDKKEETPSIGLDTKALLKKKQDRNGWN